MKKSLKRFLSTLLALTMLCSCMTIMSITAFAALDTSDIDDSTTTVWDFFGASTGSSTTYEITGAGSTDDKVSYIAVGEGYNTTTEYSFTGTTGLKFTVDTDKKKDVKLNAVSNTTITSKSHIAVPAQAGDIIYVYGSGNSSSSTVSNIVFCTSSTFSSTNMVTFSSTRSEIKEVSYTVPESFEGDTIYVVATDSKNSDETAGANTFIAAVARVRAASTSPSLKLDKTEITNLVIGDTATITATVNNMGDNYSVAWKSSDESVATVSGGVVTGVSEGTATITATATADGIDTQEATCTVKVVDSSSIAVTGVTLSPTSESIYVGDTVTLTATVAPEGVSDDTVTWSSSDSTIATVVDGVVTGVKYGTATITATSNADDSVSASATITVIPVISDRTDGATIDTLSCATQTTTYDLLATAVDAGFSSSYSGKIAYVKNCSYFDNQVLALGNGAQYQSNKTTYNFGSSDEDKNSGGIRLKTNQDYFVVRLSAGSTVSVKVTGGGSSSTSNPTRYGRLSTSTSYDGDLYETADLSDYETDIMSYTASESDKVVYISASVDCFISQIKVIVPEDIYVYFGISAEEAANSTSFSIYDDQGAIPAAENSTTVYDGIDLDKDGDVDGDVTSLEAVLKTASGTAADDCAYVIAYILDSTIDESDLSIVFNTTTEE